MEYTTSKEAVSLLKINGLYAFALSLGGIFLQIFLFTFGGFRALVIYNLASLIAILVFYMIAGWLLKYISLKNLLCVGVAGYIALFSVLFMFGERSLTMLIPLGILKGMGTGVFWAVMNMLQYIFTTDDMRHRYFGRQTFWLSLASGIAPLIGGALISLIGIFVSKNAGYAGVFFLIALLMAGILWEAQKLPDHKGVDFSMRHVIAHKRTRAWKLSLLQNFFYGLFDFMFSAFIAVLMFLVIREEFVLGVVSALSALVTAGAGLVASIILTRNRTSFIPAAALAAVGIVAFTYQQNWWGVIAFMFAFNMGMPILNIASTKTGFDVMDRSEEHWQKKYHLFFEREFSLNVGRILSFAMFLFFINDRNQVAIAGIAIGLLAVIPLLIGFVQYKMERELDGQMVG
ncbi:MAG: MFS transporter [Candidatus Sungbacteria bacterium]|nr:MFS transporter [bacterium]MDZ4260153.1 MFS transporter [Candidatus Sungbacteria bacterium]